MTTPTPEPKQYIQAQADSIGKGLRDTVLITPGSALPDSVPEGAKVYYTRKGIVLTTNPIKAAMIHNGTDEDISFALFGLPSQQTGRETLAAVVKDENNLPIAEIALNPSNTIQVMQQLQNMVPVGGLLSVESKNKSISNRFKGLLS